MRCWADEIETTPIRAAILNPGPIATKMRAAAFPGEDPATLPMPEAVTPLVLELVRHDREPPKETVNFAEWRERAHA